MAPNIGSADRTVRFVAGATLAALALASFAGVLSLDPVAAALALLVGAVLVGTAATRLCLVYRVLGVDTCSTR